HVARLERLGDRAASATGSADQRRADHRGVRAVAAAGAGVGAARGMRCLRRQAVHAGRAGAAHGDDARDPGRGRIMNAQAARILVGEDNADTAALLRDLLEGEGYEVETAATGEAAFEALGVAPDVDLMVLDLMLPGMSGYEVIERLRAQADLSD